MKVYIACLAAYNNGKLHGEWIDATQGTEHIQEGIKRVLATSPENSEGYPCEEWAVHDYDDFPSHIVSALGENPNLDDLTAIVEFIEEHGELGAAVLGEFDLEEAKRMIEENYQGEYKDDEDFVYSWYEETGQLKQLEGSGLEHYIDWQAVARDAFINDFNAIESASGIYVFYNN